MANYTILLIDYEPRSIERFRDPLIAAGYTVEIATDGIAGIEAFHRLSPDMVLVEAMIPKKHGFEVCQELKRTPHGRRTPVLITTGVYKGRKYRTQALHIYGCDEYIEKPIAPEQLLEIVGKFFGSGASARSARSTGPASAPSERSGDRISHGNDSASVRAEPSAEPPPAKTERTNPTTAPKTVEKDATEDEIMARLDSILPTGGAAPHVAEPAPVAIVATVEPEEVLPVAFGSTVKEDPFAQMRAELDAELGTLSAALAVAPAPVLEPLHEPMSSDQALSPSVLEALPAPESELPSTPPPPAVPTVEDDQPGRVVSFDTKRSRKNRKVERRNKERAPRVAAVPPARVPVPPPAIEPLVDVRQMTLPRGTLVESELEAAAGRRGMPAWAWAAVCLVAIGVTYVALSRGGVKRADLSPLPATETTDSAPAETSAPEIANASVPTPPPAPEPSSRIPESRKLELGAIKVPVPKKSSNRVAAPAAASPVSISGGSPAATGPAPTRAEAPPAKLEPVKPAQTEAPAPAGLGDSVAGVETVPESAVAAPATTIAPGTLIPIDEADALPVSLSRRLPTYSMQARQMRLSGTVVMNVLVNERGTVDQVVLVNGVAGADLNDSAIRAAQFWTYRPATKHGVPVKVWKSEQVVFKL